MTLIATPSPQIVDHTEPPPGTWLREPSHFPLPITPLSKSMFRVEEIGATISAETGSLIDRVRFIEIGGWVYIQVVPFGARPGAPTPPGWLLPVLLRVIPSVRRRLARAQKSLDADWSGRQIDAWYDRRTGLADRLDRLRHLDLAALHDNDLDARVRDALALALDCLDLHFRLHGAMAHSLRSFTTTCHTLLGWSDERSLSMLSGTSQASTEAGRALIDLARTAAGSAEVRRLLGDAPTDRVLAADAAFAAAFADYVDRFCFRALTYDLSDPTLAERPELVLNLVRDQLTLGGKPVSEPGDGAGIIAEARQALAVASEADRERFEQALAIALRAYPVREDNAYLTVCAPFALIRLFALEFGRRLTRRGVIDEVGDVFLLYLDEARAALVDRAPRQELVAQRRARRRQVLERPGPPQYGPDPAPIPALHRLPGPARTMTEDGLWLLDLITTVPARPDPGTAGTTVSGTAAARGTARGPVRIVNDESEFDKLQAGDVLVCECTSPAWSIVFPSLAAVVTNSGGILSHPAIVAREFGIPAVVATGDATTRLQDGQIIVVDGTAGTVRVVS